MRGTPDPGDRGSVVEQVQVEREQYLYRDVIAWSIRFYYDGDGR